MNARAGLGALIALLTLGALFLALLRRDAPPASTTPDPARAVPTDGGAAKGETPPRAPVAPAAAPLSGLERERSGRADFDVARQLFSAEFAAKARAAGPGEAFQLLDVALRGPHKTLESRARAYEAATQLLALLADAASGKREPRDYTSLLPAMLDRTRGLLLDGSADAGLRRILLAGLGGSRPEFHFEAEDPDGPVDVFVLVDSPLSWDGPAPPGSPAAPALADALWSLARDPAAPSLLRADALRAGGRLGGDGTRDPLLRFAVERDADLRRAAIASLAAREETLSVAEFRSIWDAQGDPLSRTSAILGLAAPLAGEPAVRDVLLSRVTAPPTSGGVSAPEAIERRAALNALLQSYAKRPDPAALEAIASCSARWATERWKSSSPLLTLAEEASKRGLKDFVPYLRAGAPRMSDPDERLRVERAIDALTR